MPSTPDTTGDIAERFAAGGWAFTPEVVEVFDDHVRASVPHYDQIQDLVAEACDWLVPDGGLIADLGASTGTTVKRILDRLPQRRVHAVLYDVETPMLEAAGKNLAGYGERIDYYHQSITDPLTHTDADLTLSLFTLQFLPVAGRLAALRHARERARSTGALVVAEKVRPVDSRWHEIAVDVSHDYKAAHGIDAEGIRAKARALRGVLVPHPQRTLIDLITEAGWHAPEVLFRWHCWTVVGAFAEDQRT